MISIPVLKIMKEIIHATEVVNAAENKAHFQLPDSFLIAITVAMQGR